ncbi:MAG: hypothetical protein JNL57_12405 [Bacteroidetes bacterium]|nr:hypothetical protein [Bacteroidota bacterium]
MQTLEWVPEYSVRPKDNAGYLVRPIIALNRENSNGFFTEAGISQLGFGNYKGMLYLPDSTDNQNQGASLQTGYFRMAARLEWGRTTWQSRNGQWRLQYAAAANPIFDFNRALDPVNGLAVSARRQASIRLEGVARLQRVIHHGFLVEMSVPVSMLDLRYSYSRNASAAAPLQTLDLDILPGRTGLRTTLVWKL